MDILIRDVNKLIVFHFSFSISTSIKSWSAGLKSLFDWWLYVHILRNFLFFLGGVFFSLIALGLHMTVFDCSRPGLRINPPSRMTKVQIVNNGLVITTLAFRLWNSGSNFTMVDNMSRNWLLNNIGLEILACGTAWKLYHGLIQAITPVNASFEWNWINETLPSQKLRSAQYGCLIQGRCKSLVVPNLW